MTAPIIPMPQAFSLRPPNTHPSAEMTVVVGATRPRPQEIALQPGVSSIKASWRGSSAVSISYYARTGGFKQSIISIPAGTGLRTVITEVAVVGTDSYLIANTTATSADLANAILGLTIIPMPVG